MRQATNHIREKIIKTLKEYFSTQESVSAVFLFGSSTGERFSDQSDIDIGVLYSQEGPLPTLDDKLQAQAELSDRLQRPVDLVVLNQVSPILGYQVLKYGERLLTRDPRVVNAFFVRTLNEYFDLKQIRQVIEQSLQNARIL